MGLTIVSPRLSLSAPAQRVRVLGDLDDWCNGFDEAGNELVSSSSTIAPDLCVAPKSQTGAAIATGADQLLVLDCSDTAGLDAAGYTSTQLTVLPSHKNPKFAIAASARKGTARYLTRVLMAPDRRWKILRNLFVEACLRVGLPPRRGMTLMAAAKRPGLPFAVSEASRRFGLPQNVEWIQMLGGGVPHLKRDVFFLFESGADQPSWVLKIARVRDYETPFVGEAIGLKNAADTGELVVRRAPRQIGAFEVDGLRATVETCQPGVQLRRMLSGLGSQSAKVEALSQVVNWLIRVGSETQMPSQDRLRELSWLQETACVRWPKFGAPPDLLAGTISAPSVFQHGDLDPQNILVDGLDFRVVDWENARRYGFPLGDLLKLAIGSFPLVDRVRPDQELDYLAQLFRGECASSPILFQWIRSVVDASDVPHGVVGALTAAILLEDGVPPWDFYENEPRDQWPLRTLLADTWLRDPDLGMGWASWQARPRTSRPAARGRTPVIKPFYGRN